MHNIFTLFSFFNYAQKTSAIEEIICTLSTHNIINIRSLNQKGLLMDTFAYGWGMGLGWLMPLPLIAVVAHLLQERSMQSVATEAKL